MGFAGKLRKAIAISRPIFWIGPMLAYRLGLFFAGIDRGPFEIVEMLLFTFPYAFIIYGLNDLFDMECDTPNPRKGGMWGAKLTKKDAPWVKKLILVFSAAIVLTALLTLNPLHIFLAFLALAVPYIYSAPPFRVKSRPMLDSLLSSAYGFGPFLFAYSLSGELFLSPYLFLFSLSFSGLHALATIMDVEYDRKAGINTFAVALGTRAPALFSLGVSIMGLILIWPYFSHSYLVSFGILLAVALSTWLTLFPTPKNARIEFNFIFAFVFFWIFYFFIKYVILGAWFADYSEMEFQTMLPELMKYIKS